MVPRPPGPLVRRSACGVLDGARDRRPDAGAAWAGDLGGRPRPGVLAPGQLACHPTASRGRRGRVRRESRADPRRSLAIRVVVAHGRRSPGGGASLRRRRPARAGAVQPLGGRPTGPVAALALPRRRTTLLPVPGRSVPVTRRGRLRARKPGHGHRDGVRWWIAHVRPAPPTPTPSTCVPDVSPGSAATRSSSPTSTPERRCATLQIEGFPALTTGELSASAQLDIDGGVVVSVGRPRPESDRLAGRVRVGLAICGL